jgi:hypothetical protein
MPVLPTRIETNFSNSPTNVSVIPPKQELFHDRPRPQIPLYDTNVDDMEVIENVREKRVRKQLDPSVKQALQARGPQRNRLSRALPAEFLPAQREDRPPPPFARPPGIPDDQPPPPTEKPSADNTMVSPRKPALASDMSVAGDTGVLVKPEPPKNESPNKKGKKVIIRDKLFVRRRDRENPEFEESSDDEEDKRDFDQRVVNQPLAETNELERLEKIAQQHLANYNKMLAISPKGDQSVANKDNISPTPSDLPVKAFDFSDKISSKAAADDTAVNIAANKVRTESVRFSPISPQSFTYEDNHSSSSSSVKVGNWTNDDSRKRAMMMDIDTQSASMKHEVQVEEIDLAAEVEPTSYNMVDDYRLAGLIPRGRFSITCLEALQLMYSSHFAHTGPVSVSLRCRLGPRISPVTGNPNPWKTTEIYTSSRHQNPNFDNEFLSFDVVDVRPFIAMNDLSLHVQLIQHASSSMSSRQEGRYMQHLKNEEVIAAVSMSVIRFFRQPFVRFEERVPLRTQLDDSTSKVSYEYLFACLLIMIMID